MRMVESLLRNECRATRSERTGDALAAGNPVTETNREVWAIKQSPRQDALTSPRPAQGKERTKA